MPASNDPYATAVSREAAWFTTDPPPSFPGAYPLQTANQGPFDVIQGYIPKDPQSKRSLYITRGKAKQARISLGGEFEIVHTFTVIVMWPLRSAKLEDDQSALDTAVAAVIQRIQGPNLDHTHGGAFLTVADDEHDIEIEQTDPLEAVLNREPIVVRITYQATDTFVG